MKGVSYFPRKALFVSGSLCLLGLVACGESSSPEAVSRAELKSPSELRLVDNGNGAVTLYWQANNYEEGFDGYNIYGVKHEAIKTTLASPCLQKNMPLQLISDDGQASSKAKSLLQKMSFNLDAPFEEAGASTAGDGKDFQAIPIQVNKDAFPTCRPLETGSSECAALTEPVTEHVIREFAGETHYTVTGLKPGTEYCFLILTSMKGGEKVSAVSSELRCIIPRLKGTMDITDIVSGSGQALPLASWVSECDGSSDCTQGQLPTTKSGQCDGNTEEALCLEIFNTTGPLHFTPGKGTAVRKLAYLPEGFSSKDIPLIPVITSFNSLTNDGGYSPVAKSIPIEADTMYVVANAVDPSKPDRDFYYHLIHVISAEIDDTGKGEVSIELLLTNTSNLTSFHTK